MEAYTLSALVTVFISLFIFFLAYKVGMIRGQHKSPPHKPIDNKHVFIANRVHMNTVEMTVVYLPLLWVATVFGPSTFAGITGILWLASRVWYAFAYLKDPKKRQTPFMLGIACIAVTAILGLYGIIF